jgi:hypothetical protein
MNNEERFLLALTTVNANIIDDLNYLLEYCTDIFEVIAKVHHDKLYQHANAITKLVLKEALANYYSSKIKLYVEEDEEEEEQMKESV